MLGFNLSVGRNRQSFGDADAQAFITATGLTGATETTAVRRLVSNLKTYGLWSKMKAIYPFVSDTNNLLSYTEDFTNAYWTVANASINANSIVAPNGTLTADKLVVNTATSTHQVRVSISNVLAQTYTMSIYAKKGELNFIRFWEDGQTGKQCYFNLNTGVATNVDMTSATIENVGNGWYRCIAVLTLPSSGVFGYRVLLTPDGTTTTFTGNGIDGVYLWGAQLEQSASVTTYQPIATTPANRFVSQFKYNLKDPRDLDAAFRLAFNGTWTYSKQGATPNGVNGYADTFFVPSANLTATSQSSSIYSRTNSNYGGSPNVDFSSVTTGVGNFSLSVGLNTVGINAFVRYGLTQDVRNTSAQQYDGYFVGSRTANNVLKLWRSNVQLVGTTTTIDTGISTLAPVIGAERTGASTVTNYANRQYAFAHTSDGLTDTEAANLYTSVQLFNQDLSRQVGVPIVSDSDAQSFLNAAQITDLTQANAINTLVVGLKNASLWTKMKAIYPFVGGTATSHKWNLKDPRDLDAAYRLAFFGAWTHSSTGAASNGTNATANTYLNASTVLTANRHFSMYNRTNATGTVTIGAIAGAAYDYIGSGTFNNVSIANNVSGAHGLPSTAKGLWTLKSSSTDVKLFYRGNLQTTINSPATGIPNDNYFIGSAPISSNFSATEFCFATIGNALTDGEATTLNTLTQSFQTSLGRQV